MDLKKWLRKIPRWSELTPLGKGLIIFVFLIGLMTILIPFCGEAQAAEIHLGWTTPTTNEDGTPCTDLAGYRLYKGEASRSYGPALDIPNETTTDIWVDVGPIEAKEMFFAITAYDAYFNESDLSNEVSHFFPGVPPEVDPEEEMLKVLGVRP